MRILKIIHGYPPHYSAGSEVYSQSICEELSRNHDVFVFTREENPYQPDFSIRTVRQHERLSITYANMAQGKDGYRHAKLDKRFTEFVDEIHPEVAHIGHLNHLSTGLVDVLVERNIPIVFTLHDFWLMCPRGQFLQRNFGNETICQLCDKQEDRKCATNCYNAYFSQSESEEDIVHWTNWIHQRMIETRSIIEKVNMFIAPSRYLMDRFVNEFGIPQSKIVYLDYGFPTHYLKPVKQHSDKSGFAFGYIGTHITAKGVNLLIDAFKNLSGNARLLIWGSKDQQSTNALREQAKGSNLSIEFKGNYVNKNLADEVFSQVDCIVVPSIWGENSPLVIHEAQACRLPVITANYGGMKEYVEHGVNGLLFEHRSVISLTEQMQWAIDHQAEFADLGKKGYLFNEDGSVPDIQSHVKQLTTIYRSIGNSKSQLWRITIDTNPEDCNLQCIMCEEHSPYSTFIDDLYRRTGTRKRRMPVEWLDKIFDQAKHLGVTEVIPSTMGEPLIYPAIDKIYELAKLHNIRINLTTNGTFPRRSVTEWAKIIIPQTSDVKFSWNGATKETAEKIMNGLDYDTVLNNVREFINIRDSHFQQTGVYCRVTFQLTFMNNNMHELADIVQLAARLNVDRVKGHHLWDHFEEIKSLSMKSTAQSVQKWNEYVQQAHETADEFRKPDGSKVLLENITPIEENLNRIVPDNYECPFLGKELWISATGKISPCCAPDQLRTSLGNFGNIQHSGIEEVVDSPEYSELVKNYRKKELCKSCNMRKPC